MKREFVLFVANLPEFCSYFPQCSGMKYTVHQKSDMVTDVKVFDRGSGKIITFNPKTTRDALEQYMVKDLNGQLGDAYMQPQGRITIVDD